jgi:hypothetical protein
MLKLANREVRELYLVFFAVFTVFGRNNPKPLFQIVAVGPLPLICRFFVASVN